jgi:hypothetical protein
MHPSFVGAGEGTSKYQWRERSKSPYQIQQSDGAMEARSLEGAASPSQRAADWTKFIDISAADVSQKLLDFGMASTSEWLSYLRDLGLFPEIRTLETYAPFRRRCISRSFGSRLTVFGPGLSTHDRYP